MKTINVDFTNIDDLKVCCEKNNMSKYPNILLQIFTSIIDKEYIENLVNSIKSILPNVKIIGATTNGEILHGNIVSDKTVLSFSLFEKTTIKTYCTQKHNDSQEAIENLINSIEDIKKAKVVIAFTNGAYINSEYLISLFNKHAPHITIAGGLAGNNEKHNNIYVFTHKGIKHNQAALAVLYGDDLIVNTSLNFGWEYIGKDLKITNAKGNVVYTIDNIPAIEAYRKYLGDEIDTQLSEFPLMFSYNNSKIARAAIRLNEDGSLTFAGNVTEGEIAHFGYKDVQNILNDRYETFRKFSKKPTQGIFVYSCMARKKILENDIANEFIPLEKIAPVSGFFTYGEFYHSNDILCNKNHLFNHATTILSLSESDEVKKSMDYSYDSELSQSTKRLKSFINLVNITTKELKESKQQMQKYIDLINEHIITLSIDLDGYIIDASNALCDISGYEKKELLKAKNSIFPHLEMSKTNKCKLIQKINENHTHKQEIKCIKKCGNFFWIDTAISTIFDEYGSKIGYTAICHDITNKKILEELSITDGLTNIFNRRYFDTIFPKIIGNAKRKNELFSFLLIDIDSFKQYNDNYGHQKGDEVLIKVASCINSQLKRGGDYCFRLGGEEFAVIISVEYKDQAIALSEKIRKEVENLKIVHEKNPNGKYVTISIGLFSKYIQSTNCIDIYSQADYLMYEAKKRGKNQVIAN